MIHTLKNGSSDEQEILYHLAGNLATRRTQYSVRKYLKNNNKYTRHKKIKKEKNRISVDKGRYFTANSLAQLSGLLPDFAAPPAEGVRKEIKAIGENTEHKICFVSFFPSFPPPSFFFFFFFLGTEIEI